MTIKHLWYLDYSKFIKAGSINEIKKYFMKGAGIESEDAVITRVMEAISDSLKFNFRNSPTLYTSMQDYLEALEYEFMKNATELYIIAKDLNVLEIEKRLYINGGHESEGTRTGAGTDNSTTTSEGETASTSKGTGSNNFKHATTPTTLPLSTPQKWYDEATTDENENTGETSGTSKNTATSEGKTTNEESYKDETIYKVNFNDLLTNIEKLSDKLYNKIEHTISKCMYNLLYDIEC